MTSPTPQYQPSSATILEGNTVAPSFESSEIWWWDNGIWGAAGYAIPNDGGKLVSGNDQLVAIHRFIGAELFSLMHKDDVKFSRPFNIEWLKALIKALDLGIKRLGDYSIGFTDKRLGDSDHQANTPQAFTVYPIPYFGNRIRQQDALRWAGQILRLLGEIMQHTDNDFDDDVTDFSVSMIQEKLMRIKKDVALKYFGYTRTEVDAVDANGASIWVFDKTRFQTYDPTQLFTDRELIEERMPTLWYPNTNDLTPIAGIPAPNANVFRKRWPIADGFDGDGHAYESAFPNAVPNTQTTVNSPTGGSGVVSGATIVPSPLGN